MRGSKREFFTVLSGRVAMAILSLGLLQALLYVLDAREYGAFIFLQSMALSLSMLVFNPGIVPIVRLVAGSAEPGRLGAAIVRFLVRISLPVALLSMAVVAGIVAVADNLGNAAPAVAVPAIAGIALGTGLVMLIGGFAQGRRQRLANLILSNGIVLLRILMVLAAGMAGLGTVTGALVAIAAAGLCVAAAGLVYMRRAPAGPAAAGPVPDLAALGFFRQYRQNWPIVASSAFFQYVDKVVLGFVLPLELLGLLAIYQQIARMLSTLTVGVIYQYLAPFRLSEGGGRRRNVLASVAALAGFLPVAGLMSLVLPWANAVLLHGVYDVSALPFVAVCVTFALIQASQINELEFFRADRVGLLFWPLVAAIVLFLVLGPLLAASFGLWGAIASLLVVTALRYVNAMWLMRRL